MSSLRSLSRARHWMTSSLRRVKQVTLWTNLNWCWGNWGPSRSVQLNWSCCGVTSSGTWPWLDRSRELWGKEERRLQFRWRIWHNRTRTTCSRWSTTQLCSLRWAWLSTSTLWVRDREQTHSWSRPVSAATWLQETRYVLLSRGKMTSLSALYHLRMKIWLRQRPARRWSCMRGLLLLLQAN